MELVKHADLKKKLGPLSTLVTNIALDKGGLMRTTIDFDGNIFQKRQVYPFTLRNVQIK